MSSAFDDILQRAERLTAENIQKQIGASASATAEKRTYGASFDTDLNNIFRSSEHLWKRKAADGNAPRSFLFGEKGVVLGGQAPQLQQPVTAVCDERQQQAEWDEDVERVRLESERAFFNHVLLSQPQPTIQPANNARSGKKPSDSFRSGVVSSAMTSRRELVFGDRLAKWLRSGKTKNLCQLFSEAAAEAGTDGHLAEVWAEAAAMCHAKASASQNEQQACAAIVDNASTYLQKTFVTYMRGVVERNLERAERGGVPGTRALVAAFLKAQDVEYVENEDGAVDGLPVWQVIYTCLRAGEVAAAKDALSAVHNPRAAQLTAALNHLAGGGVRLDADMKTKLKVEWRHEASAARDVHRRACYAALLGQETPLADNMENWLWLKLYALKVDPQSTPALLAELQRLISCEFGESYFMGGDASQWHLYFSALWLSGQWERAVQLLFDCGEITDAVHVAVLAHHCGLLRLAEKSDDKMLVSDDSSVRCRLNLARLLVVYTKEFELSDVARALDYWFLLKGVRTPSGGCVFEMAVSRAVYLSGETAAILGFLNDNGRRVEGLIDQYDVEPLELIARVAKDTELNGEVEQAVQLYLLAGDPSRATHLMCGELAEAIRAGPGATLDGAVVRAEKMLGGSRGVRADGLSTLCQLIDIAGLVSLCEAGRVGDALTVLKGLNLLPADGDAIHKHLTQFHLVPEKVREVLPDVCVHVMRACVAGVGGAGVGGAVDARTRTALVKQANAVVLYAATVPYKFPAHVNSKLLQMQATIS